MINAKANRKQPTTLPWRHAQSGLSVVAMLFVSVVMIALISAVVSKDMGNAAQVSVYTKTSQITAQAQLIRQQISKCATDYSAGDNGTANHKPYPLGTDALVAAITCPGSGMLATIDASDELIFSGKDGVFIPVQIQDFGAWKYTNDATSVRVYTDANDTRWNTSIAAAVAKFTEATTPIPNSGKRFEIKITN